MRIIKIPKKKKGEFRTIYAPNEREKYELRKLLPKLHSIFFSFEENRTIPDDIIHGFVTGRSPVTNALKHVGYSYTLSIDLKDFFDSVKSEHLKDILPDSLLKLVLFEGSPKQGLPTSPVVANIAAIKMDILILNFIKTNNWNVIYTRYADDLSLSFNDRSIYPSIKDSIHSIIKESNFVVNESKTRLQSQSFGNREITGVMVGDTTINIPRRTKKLIRSMTHNGESISELKGLLEWARLKTPYSINKMPSKYKVLNEKLIWFPN